MTYAPRENEIIAFTDGASRGNPGPGGWGALVVSDEQVVELGGAERSTTNNRMELEAIIAVCEYVQGHQGVLTIFTDSQYALSGITKWIHGWKQNNWQTQQKTEVSNKELWQRLDGAIEDLNIQWKKLPGHSGVPGNERADAVATQWADGKEPALYKGSRKDYQYQYNIHDLFDIRVSSVDAEKKERSKMKAYSYLSLVDGVLEKHTTWDECKQRVDGKKGVKFRKAVSKEDEEAIMKEWGV